MPALMREAGVPGLSIAVIRDAAVVWTGAYGVTGGREARPVTVDTIFEAASLSKPVFGYGVLKLCEAGMIALDRPVVEYLPAPYSNFPYLRDTMRDPADPRLAGITARHLLSHSAGFGNWSAGTIGRLQSEPGQRFAYSGEGYIFLQRVIEHLTGRPVADLLAAEVLRPLGMSESDFVWRESYAGRAAAGHGPRSEYVGSRWSEAFAAYSLYTTAPDYARFVLETMRAAEAGLDLPGTRSLLALVTPAIRAGRTLAWGAGWGIDTTAAGDYFWQWGDLGDFTSFALGSRSRRDGLAVFTNGAGGLSIFGRIIQAALGIELPTLSDPAGPI